jgi:hypothetical protein
MIQEWDGAEEGPYRQLSLGPVPDNIEPSAPAQHVKFLFDVVNMIWRTLSNQASRSKQVMIAAKGDEADMENLRTLGDGDTACLNEPDSTKVLTFGNIDNNLYAFGVGVEQAFDQAAGNLSAKAGLGASSPTLGQDRMIHGQVGRSEGFASQRMNKFASRIGCDLGYLLYSDPVRTLEYSDRMPGTSYEYSQQWTPGDREGAPDDYDIAVEEYSMRYRSPEERLAQINQQLAATAPFQPAMQQQGIAIDWWEYWDTVAELTGEPRFRWLIKAQGQPIEDSSQGTSHDATQAPHTVRESVRRNEPSGATPQGQAQQMIQGMMTPREANTNGQAA